MLMQFGQFLDHDISLSPVTQLRRGGIQCCPRPTHPDCFEIPIPPFDSFFARMGKRCINFVRSMPCESCKTGHRLQMNELTSFIDASNVYGNTLNETFSLRDKDGMSALQLLRSKFNWMLDFQDYWQLVSIETEDIYSRKAITSLTISAVNPIDPVLGPGITPESINTRLWPVFTRFGWEHAFQTLRILSFVSIFWISI